MVARPNRFSQVPRWRRLPASRGSGTVRPVILRHVGRDDAAVDELERRVDQEMGPRRVSLGVEQLEQIHAALRQSERGCRRVEVQHSARSRVEPTEIDGKLAVDEDPDVVVSFEHEELSAVVLELGMKFRGKTEVVLPGIVANGEASPAGVVERKESSAAES